MLNQYEVVLSSDDSFDMPNMIRARTLETARKAVQRKLRKGESIISIKRSW
jgi:ribosomal protein L16/L10AE